MRWMLTILGIASVLLGAFIAIAFWSYHPSSPGPLASTLPATAPVAARFRAAPKPDAPVAPRIQAYSDLLHVLPGMADATISETKLPLEQVARIHLPYWAYICPRRDLWISHPEAPPLSSGIDDGSRTVHLTREQIVFVHWARNGKQVKPYPIFRDDAGGFQIFRKGLQPAKLKRFDYHWPQAISTEDMIVVPTDLGVAAIHVGHDVAEDYRQLTDEQQNPPCVELTPNGFLAWIPASVPDAPKSTIAWMTKGQWAQPPADEWGGPFVHLVTFADGSVLQIAPEAAGIVTLRVATLESATPDAARIRECVTQLSDDDADVRDTAHAQLIAMGPAAWKQLEQMLPNQQGEALVRMQEITRSRTQPKLGRFEVVDRMLRPIWHLSDGVVFLAEAGVRVTNGSGQTEPITPAWISVRRGQPISLLPPTLARCLAVGTVDLLASGGEWVVSEEKTGAQLFFGQELLPLTGAKDLRYRRLAGIDRNARVLLAPMDTKAYASDFMLIDPSVPDQTPLIQIWAMAIENGEAGWTADNWPAIKRGQPWVLKGDNWEPLKDELLRAAPLPTTQPSVSGTLTQMAGSSEGRTLWTNASMLALQQSDGKQTLQPRPAAMPSADLAGILIKDRAYLLHPGRKVSRLRVNLAAASPFALDAVFTEDVPDFAGVTKIWLDGNGRLCITTDDARLIILFLDRTIPPALLDMIPANELKQAKPAQ